MGTFHHRLDENLNFCYDEKELHVECSSTCFLTLGFPASFAFPALFPVPVRASVPLLAVLPACCFLRLGFFCVPVPVVCLFFSFVLWLLFRAPASLARLESCLHFPFFPVPLCVSVPLVGSFLLHSGLSCVELASSNPHGKSPLPCVSGQLFQRPAP